MRNYLIYRGYDGIYKYLAHVKACVCYKILRNGAIGSSQGS